MKFIHAADIHLGSPFKGLKNIPEQMRKLIIESTNQAFQKLINQAIAEKVDFILIVGDLFDDPQPDLETLDFAFEAFDQLNQANIPVFLSFGNHDYLNPKIPTTFFPENVKIFNQDVSTKELTLADGTKIGLTNFSYAKRAELDQRIETYPARNPAYDFQIGMLHGSMDGLNSSEAHYAPFTVSQLLSKNYDYWALGHIHKRQVLNDQPLIAYSGNTQGRHINEPGIKGVSLVTVDPQKNMQIKFLQTDVVEWSNLAIELQDEDQLDDILDRIEQNLSAIEHEELQIINLDLLNSDQLSSAVIEELQEVIVLKQLQKKYIDQNIWVYRLSLKVSPKAQIFTQLDEEYWKQAAKKVFTPRNIQDQLGRLLDLDFVQETYGEDVDVHRIQEQVEIMLKQRNVLGDKH